MKGSLAWFLFAVSSLACLAWIGIGVGDELREKAVFEDGPARRLELAGAPGDTVRVGIVGDWKRHGAILQGAEIAVRELNAAGGVLGSFVVLDVRDDGGTEDGALRAAQDFADTPEIALVIGHTEPELNAATAGIYETFGLLRFSPNCAGEEGSGERGWLLGNGKPSEVTAGEILDLAREHGWTELGLVYERNCLNMDLARRLESMAAGQEIRFPVSVALQGEEQLGDVFVPGLKRERGLDAMVFAVSDSALPSLVSDIREAGFSCPYVVAGGAVAAPGNTGAPSRAFCLFRGLGDGEGERDFEKISREKFRDISPGEALLGYDAVRVLARAVVQAGSFMPKSVGEVLRSGLCD